jgi:hypothetical protein
VRITGSTVTGSVIGDGQSLNGQTVANSVMDGGEIAPAR